MTDEQLNQPITTEVQPVIIDTASEVEDALNQISMGNDWKKTGVKIGIVAGEVIVAGAIAYFANQPALIFLVPVFEGFLDWLKHR